MAFLSWWRGRGGRTRPPDADPELDRELADWVA